MLRGSGIVFPRTTTNGLPLASICSGMAPAAFAVMSCPLTLHDSSLAVAGNVGSKTSLCTPVGNHAGGAGLGSATTAPSMASWLMLARIVVGSLLAYPKRAMKLPAPSLTTASRFRQRLSAGSAPPQTPLWQTLLCGHQVPASQGSPSDFPRQATCG